MSPVTFISQQTALQGFNVTSVVSRNQGQAATMSGHSRRSSDPSANSSMVYRSGTAFRGGSSPHQAVLPLQPAPYQLQRAVSSGGCQGGCCYHPRVGSNGSGSLSASQHAHAAHAGYPHHRPRLIYPYTEANNGFYPSSNNGPYPQYVPRYQAPTIIYGSPGTIPRVSW